MELFLQQVQGSGNSFYIYETKNENELDWRSFSIWLCDQNNNGGADGLLLVIPSNVADAKMRVINADGSEASMCGNGLRCVARYICDKKGQEEACIETKTSVLKVKRVSSIYKTIPTFKVEISPVSYQLSSLPMHYKNKQTIKHEIIDEFSREIRFTAVSVPNPHLIGIVTKPFILDTSHQEQLSTFLNSENEYFPDGVNVSYVFPMDHKSIYVRTYERGVGFTNACGTAMSASALIAHELGLVQEKLLLVYNPGGFVKCHVNKSESDLSLSLIGNATILSYHTLQMNKPLQFHWLQTTKTNEQDQYVEMNQIAKRQTNFL